MHSSDEGRQLPDVDWHVLAWPGRVGEHSGTGRLFGPCQLPLLHTYCSFLILWAILSKDPLWQPSVMEPSLFVA